MKENNSEFKAALEYIKPDIIYGTESWLRGTNQENNTAKMPSSIRKYSLIVLMSLEMIEALEAVEFLLLFDQTSRLLSVWTLLRTAR